MKNTSEIRAIIIAVNILLISSNIFGNIIQINIDDFSPTEMERALRTQGTIELVGPSIEKLAKDALSALETAKEILSLPIETLKSVEHQKEFHGFQNVKEETSLKGQTRNQIAFHFKPYKQSRMPESISDTNLQAYYENGMTILHRLYNEINNVFKNIHKSDLTNDEQSVLTARRYFQSGSKGSTGIPPHSDYGLLTLVTSDEPGLEVKNGDEWIEAPSKPAPRFYVNIGDWLLFQLGNKEFIAGIHRVPEVAKERYSLALFLNPNYNEKLKTPSGKMATYKEFLFSDKILYLAK